MSGLLKPSVTGTTLKPSFHRKRLRQQSVEHVACSSLVNHAIFQMMCRVAEAPLRAAALQIRPGSIFLIIITPSSRQSGRYDCQEIKRTQHPVNLKIKHNPQAFSCKKKKEF